MEPFEVFIVTIYGMLGFCVLFLVVGGEVEFMLTMRRKRRDEKENEVQNKKEGEG